jgi:hypothetical protein
MRQPPPIEQRKISLGIAWDDFVREIEEARCLIKHGAESNAIAEMVRHARELFHIIEWEIANSPCVTASARDGRGTPPTSAIFGERRHADAATDKQTHVEDPGNGATRVRPTPGPLATAHLSRE